MTIAKQSVFDVSPMTDMHSYLWTFLNSLNIDWTRHCSTFFNLCIYRHSLMDRFVCSCAWWDDVPDIAHVKHWLIDWIVYHKPPIGLTDLGDTGLKRKLLAEKSWLTLRDADLGVKRASSQLLARCSFLHNRKDSADISATTSQSATRVRPAIVYLPISIICCNG